MGFWGAFGKIVQGKPVFEEPTTPVYQSTSAPASAQQPAVHPWLDERGQKIIPHIDLQHLKSVINDDVLEVTAWVVNTSSLEIELDKIVLLNTRTELDRRLQPNQSRQIVLYHGPLARDDSAHKANLYYKIVQNGDYFRCDYMVVHHREASGMYCVDRLQAERDIHDI